MMIQITLPSDLEEKLRDRAAKVGKDMPTVIVDVLREKLQESDRIDAILAPFRAAFSRSGCSDDELDSAIESARDDVWRIKQGQGTPSPSSFRDA